MFTKPEHSLLHRNYIACLVLCTSWYAPINETLMFVNTYNPNLQKETCIHTTTAEQLIYWQQTYKILFPRETKSVIVLSSPKPFPCCVKITEYLQYANHKDNKYISLLKSTNTGLYVEQRVLVPTHVNQESGGINKVQIDEFDICSGVVGNVLLRYIHGTKTANQKATFGVCLKWLHTLNIWFVDTIRWKSFLIDQSCSVITIVRTKFWERGLENRYECIFW